MTKVQFTTVTEVEMDDYNPSDIIEMGKSIAQAGKSDIEGICQSSNVVSVKALPIPDEIDCLEDNKPEVSGVNI